MSIPGEPGVDFPVYSAVPDTGFDCAAQDNPGIYTDTEADCQVPDTVKLLDIFLKYFHIYFLTFNYLQSFYMCSPGGDSAAFLCPNGTIFNQQYFVCDWWYNIDCAQQPQYYGLNSLLAQDQEKPNCQTLFCKDD